MGIRTLLLAVLVLAGCAAPGGVAPYGEPVRFAKGREIVFRDFSMTYLGERRVASPVFRPGFTFQDFRVWGAREVKTVSWSSGTGVIDAADFEIEGRPYALELRGSVARKGWLRDDEMVVWPAAEWRKAQGAR